MRSGIYTITNIIDNKLYVGHTHNFDKRFREHRNDLIKNRHKNRYLQRAWNTYKQENFIFEILEECEEEFLCCLEHYWCNLLDTHNREYGYNLALTDPNKGRRGCSEETRKLLSIKHTGKKFTKKHIENMSLSRKMNPKKYWLGKKLSSGHKEKLKGCGNKKVFQYDLDMNLIKEYPSLSSTLLESDNFNISSISACCRYKQKSYKNSIWKYE